jgi:predicted RNA-binding protein with TRAM domain
MKVGETIEVEILRITDEGKGVAFHTNGMTVIIEGVSPEDEYVNVQITNILEETIFGNKISGKKRVQNTDDYEGLKESPYEMDDEEEDDFEE